MKLKTLLNVITNCKNNPLDYEITLNSLHSLKDKIRLISVIRCEENFVEDFKKLSEPFKNKSLIFNSDNGLYNALNIGIKKIDKKLPFICLHSGDLIFEKNKDFLINLLSQKMPKNTMYLFNTYFFNLKDQNLKKLATNTKEPYAIKNLVKREPSNNILRSIYLFFSYNNHQSIIYSPDICNLEFNENVGLTADLLYNHKAYKNADRKIRFNKILSIFNKNGLSSTAPKEEKIKSRFLILFHHPSILLDQRFLKGLIAILLKKLIR